MQEIYLSEALSAAEAEALKGHKMSRESYNRLITEPARVYKPNGDLLLQLCRNAVSDQAVSNAWEFIDKSKEPIKNRGVAAGVKRDEAIQYKKLILAGYVTNTNSIPDKLAKTLGDSAIVGYFDRYQRFPYCRQCATNRDFPEAWRRFQPLVREIDSAFRAAAPDPYRIQRAFADATNPSWVIRDTAFTTITVNRNFRTAAHTDSGDLEEGFGVMTYLQLGRLSGGFLVIPRYKIAVKLQHKDVLLFDVHEYHGNTITKKEPGTQRVTLVCYFRKKMIRCGTPDYEHERAKIYSQKRCLYDLDEIDRGREITQQILEQKCKVSI